MKRLLTLSGLVVCFCAGMGIAAEVVRIPLSGPIRMSADGEWFSGRALGLSTIDDGPALLWSPTYGFRNLGTLPGNASSFARGISADGSVVVGFSGNQAFRWSEAGGMSALGSGSASAVSSNGSTVAGTSDGQLWTWTTGGGMANAGLPNGASVASVTDISGGGTTLTGYAGYPGPTTRPFIWDSTNGFQELTPGLNGFAFAVSGNGNSVVGTTSMDLPFRWSRENGVTQLPMLSSAQGARADVVVPDASIIMGEYFPGPGGVGSGVVVWDEQHGARDLRQLLIGEHGFSEAQLPSLNETEGQGLSADAMTLAVTTFSQGTRTRWAIFLDKPLVNIVPESATWALGSIGVIAIALVLRRQRLLSRRERA
jgi:uncharacterized membrane protein